MSIPQTMPFQSAFVDMDQSFKVNRWASGPSQQAVQNVFMRYASGNQSSRQQVQTIRTGESQRRYVTEISNTSYGDKFKKMKFNQMETLKELRQQYQILRNLPLQDEFLKHSHTKKQSASDYSSARDEQDSSLTSSKQTNNRKKQRGTHSPQRDNQILTMQKRQLELVIGNSMRKIQQLLNNQIQYKKVIHQLQIQLDSRSSQDKLQGLAKTMKKNQSQLNDRIQSLKRDIQRLKIINQQLMERNQALQAELAERNQQIRRTRDQKRVLEDSIRSEKDRYLNLQIQLKRIRMQSQVTEKDKNNQINRLKSLLQTAQSLPKVQQGVPVFQVRKLQEQLRALKNRYQMLSHQYERYKRDTIQRPVIKDKPSSEDNFRIFQALITHLREDSANQSRATMDLISSMVHKIDEKNQRQKYNKQKQRSKQKKKQRQSPEIQQGIQTSNRLLEQMFNLRNQVSTLKKQRDDLSRSNPIISNLTESMADYQHKIRKLQQQIADGTITKENLIKQYQIIKSSYNYTRDEYEKLMAENRKLKQRLNFAEQNIGASSQQMKVTFQQKQAQYQNIIRQIRRQLDDALFAADKSKKQKDHAITLIIGQNQSKLRLLSQQVARAQSQKQALRGQLLKMRTFYQAKIQQKNLLMQKTGQEFAMLIETKERALMAFKGNSERQINQLIAKIEGVAALNERYLRQSAQLANAERQLHELRYLVRKLKGMNDGVDHLWQVKETQYFNLNQLLKNLYGQ